MVDDDGDEQDQEMSHDYDDTYPELYRKENKMKKTTNPSTKDPFDIGIIKNIWSDQDEKRVRITTLKLDRPSKEEAFEKDLNVVYLSYKVRTIDVKKDLRGKCFVWPETAINENGQTAEQWTDEGNSVYLSIIPSVFSNYL